MAVWDYISGTTDSLRRNAPDLLSVKSSCSSSYGYGKAGVNSVHNAVKVNADMVLTQCWPSEETRSKILPFVTNVAKYSAEEGLKFVPLPGGVSPISAYKIVKRSIHDVNKSADRVLDAKALCAKVDKLEKELGQQRKLLEQLEMNKQYCLDFKSSKTPNSDSISVANQKPEDVIRVFMTKDFIGRQFFDDLLVPGAWSRKK